MRHSFLLFCTAAALLLCLPLAMPTPSIAEQATATATTPEPTRQMLEHLQAMDQRLRQRLLKIAESGSTDISPITASAEEIQRLRRHLDSLENRLHGWDLEGTDALIEKVRALRPWVDNLERASLTENRGTATASLAKMRNKLRVEGAPAHTPLKNGTNDDCAAAIPIGDGTYFGDTSNATADGESCIDESPDVWFAYTSPVTTEILADTSGSSFNPVLSVHTGCPGTSANEIACAFGPRMNFIAEAGVEYLIRLAGCCGNGGETGPFTLYIGPGGTIAGTVTDAVTGEPVAGAVLNAGTEEGYFAGFAITDAVGNYAFTALSTGTYFVNIERHEDYLPEIYDDQPCSSLGCDPLSGTPIEVVTGATTGGIDIGLRRGGTITGTVTKAATGDPIDNMVIRISDSQGNFVGHAQTLSAGTYSWPGLYPGTYYANTESSLYRGRALRRLALPTGGLRPDARRADRSELRRHPPRALTFALDGLGAISGTVSDSVTGFPIPSVIVNVWDADGQYLGDAYVDSTGAYRAAGLDAGTYFVTTDIFGYFDELYDGLPCEPQCDPTAGEPVAVSLESTHPRHRLRARTPGGDHRHRHPPGDRRADLRCYRHLGQCRR